MTTSHRTPLGAGKDTPLPSDLRVLLSEVDKALGALTPVIKDERCVRLVGICVDVITRLPAHSSIPTKHNPQ